MVIVKTTEFPIERADQLAWSLLGIRGGFDAQEPERLPHRRPGRFWSPVRPGSQLADCSTPGDVIRQIDDAATATHDEFRRVLVKARYKNSLMLLIQRGEQGYYVTVTPESIVGTPEHYLQLELRVYVLLAPAPFDMPFAPFLHRNFLHP
jgi:hypothetical protein